MLIENYFEEIKDLLTNSTIIKTCDFDMEKRTADVGFIRANLILIDGSRLYIREFLEVEMGITRGKYSYQYIDRKEDLIFRYDNAPHHQKLKLPSFPHHKHDHGENRVIASKAPFLKDVLQEIEQIIDN